jgi:Domain of unknown function (DUF4328)
MTTTERADEGPFLPPAGDLPRLPPRTLAPPPPPPLAPAPIVTWTPMQSRPSQHHVYRSPRLLGRLCSAAFIVAVAAAGVAVAATSRTIDVRDRLLRNPSSVSVEEVTRSDDHLLVTAVVLVGAWLFAVALLIALTHRLYRNLRAISSVQPRFSPGWAIGAWFVPFLNIVRPKQIVDEIWRTSAPPAQGRSNRPRVPALFLLWWITWLFWPVAIQFAGSDVGSTEAEAARDRLYFMVAAWGGALVCSTLTVVVVHRLVGRQRRRAAELLGEAMERPTRGHPAGTAFLVALTSAAVGVAAVVGGIAAFAPEEDAVAASGGSPIDSATSTGSSPEPGEATDDGGRLVDALEPGHCLDLPGEVSGATPGESVSVSTVRLRLCTEPHDAEVIATVQHPAPLGTPYPGDAVVINDATAACLPQFESVVGIAFANSTLDMLFMHPTDGWDLGDRQILCIVDRRDHQKLTATVVGSAI